MPVMTVVMTDCRLEFPHTPFEDFTIKYQKKNRVFYNYTILHTVNITTREVLAGELATVVGYQFVRC